MVGSPIFSAERFLELQFFTKYFASRVTAVDVFYCIYKAAVFKAEQLILGVTVSQYIESLRLKNPLSSSMPSS